jgi:hypothetical protein
MHTFILLKSKVDWGQLNMKELSLKDFIKTSWQFAKDHEAAIKKVD